MFIKEIKKVCPICRNEMSINTEMKTIVLFKCVVCKCIYLYSKQILEEEYNTKIKWLVSIL